MANNPDVYAITETGDSPLSPYPSAHKRSFSVVYHCRISVVWLTFTFFKIVVFFNIILRNPLYDGPIK